MTHSVDLFDNKKIIFVFLPPGTKKREEVERDEERQTLPITTNLQIVGSLV